MAYEFNVSDFLGEDPDDRQPIHTAEINGATLRFFASKAQAVDLPWIPARDIGAICGFDEKTASLVTIAAVNKWMDADIIRTIKVGGKKEIVFPYLLAMCLLMQLTSNEAEEPALHVSASVMPFFGDAVAAATRAIIGPLALTAGQAFELMLSASRNAYAPPGFTLEYGVRPADPDDDGDESDEDPNAPEPEPEPKAPQYA